MEIIGGILSFLAYWMREDESCTITVLCVKPYTSAKVFYYTACDGESQTCSLLEGVYLFESLEHEIGFVSRYSAACIGYADAYLVYFHRILYSHGYRTVLCEFLRIGQQVVEHLMQT